MFGIVIATDEKFAEGLKDASEVILGPSKHLEAMGLHLGDNVETFGQTIQKAVLSVNQGEGVLVLVDVKGASPYNQSLLEQHQLQDQIEGEYRMISGVNLPMLLEALNQRLIGTSLEDAVESIVASGQGAVDVWMEESADDDF